ncbi:MAG TPA: 2Fe-2S iron-sulfur cluster-binding protein [Pyrinomonadaceae bacterium]|jgi:hypothetical protein|nr:2Fe-2S iron-sulfur cluster-binding protein [Pyrinomonadaceae bacterium]
MIENELFEPYEKLVEIEICGKKALVPENNMLLRCFQFLSLESVSMGDFCWNADCANCQVWLEAAEEGGKEKPALSCRTRVEEGMKIVRMADEIDLGDSD